MTWSFIKHISQHLERPKLGEQKAPTLWPSSATAIIDEEVIGKCRRQSYFRFAKDSYHFDPKYDHLKPLVDIINEHKAPPSKYLQWIWIQGSLYEDYCINLAKESGVYIGDQISVYVPGYNISGKLDLIVINPETTKLHIVEVKSVYGFNANSVLGTEAQHKKNLLGNRIVMSHSGTKKTKFLPNEWCKKLQDFGAGEILLTSIDKEGTWEGFDKETISAVSDQLKIPVIANGGCGSVEDIEDLLLNTNVSAVALGSILVFQKKGMGVLVNFPDRKRLDSINQFS